MQVSQEKTAKTNWKKLALTTLRWTIAVLGVSFVLTSISLSDRVQLVTAGNQVVTVKIEPPSGSDPETVNVTAPPQYVGVHQRNELVNKPDFKSVTLNDGRVVKLRAVDLGKGAGIDDVPQGRGLLVADSDTAEGRWVGYNDVNPPYHVHTPYPLVDAGVRDMLAKADPKFLWAAFLIFPLTFLITSYRWYVLCKILEINIPLPKAFVINMVGSFYNTFMPGSTGGDLLKAYYASKVTPHRTRAVMSVIVDRVLGLLALIILGGISACFQLGIPACRKVALGSGAIISVTTIGCLVFYVPFLRKLTGLDFIISKLPMQKQVRGAMETMELYRKRPLTVLWSLIVSLPVHMTVISSAMFAGLAFGILKDNPFYFWVAVPVIVLSGSIPISPQGVGVMEGFAVLLLQREGGTIAQAFALCMSIRIVAILWNLSGGLFVLRGGFHAPSESEKHTMATETESTAPPAAAA